MHFLPKYLLAINLLFISTWSLAQKVKPSNYSISQLDSIIDDCYQKGDLRAALPFAKEAKLLAEKKYGKQDSIYASCLGTYAFFLSQNALYEDAEALMREELELLANKKGRMHSDYAMALNNLAALCIRSNQLESAEPILLEALKIWRQLLGKQHQYYSISLNNLAALYDDLNRHEEAENLYYEVIELRRRTVGNKHPLFAAALNNLAFNYSKQKLFSEAIPLHQEVLDILEIATERNHFEYASAMLNLAFCYEKTGRNGDAEKLYLKALDKKEQTVGKKHPSYISTLNLLIELYIHTLRLEKAKTTLHKALELNSNHSILLNLNDLNFFNSLSTFHYKQEAISSLEKLSKLLSMEYHKSGDIKKLEQQLYCSNYTMALLEQYRHEFSSEQDRIQITAITPTIAEKGLKAIWELQQKKDNPTLKQNAFAYFEQTKSAVLREILQSKQSKHFGELPPKLALQVESLQQKQASLHAKVLTVKKGSNTDLLDTYIQNNQELENLRGILAKEYPKYYQFQYSLDQVQLQKIQEQLPKDAALIEYFLVNQLFMAICITHNHIAWYNLSIPKEENLQEHITQFRQAISDFDFIHQNQKLAFSNFSTSSFGLYQNILSPIIEGLPAQIQQLIIIPDHKLHFIPFEALLTKPADLNSSYKNLPYLMNDYQVSYDYSASLWLQRIKRPILQNNQVLGMAAIYESQSPKFVLRSASLQQTRSVLQDLPFSRTELSSLSKQLKGKFYIGKTASEANFKMDASNFGVIHLALHSSMDNQNPLLSGLVFSEDGDSTENNLLQSYEISQLNLETNLVVLSACETGYGSLQHGEGLMSIGRAFLYAGAPSMVVSLWQIHDESTTILMEYFYQNLAKGDNKAEALRKAKRFYLNSADGIRAHPAFWAALIQLGDTRPIPLEIKNSDKFNYYYIGLSLLVFGILLILWRSNTKN